MSGQIARLEINEVICIHPASLKLLQINLGVEGSQAVIERAAFEISCRLARLEAAAALEDVESLGRIGKGLIGISTQIGLMLFAKIAGDVVECAKTGDRAALFAVTARLLRIGEASIVAALMDP